MKPPVLDYVRLAGERAVLRPVTREDARHAFPMLHERRPILDWLIWQGPRDEAELAEIYSSWVARGELGSNYHLAIEHRETGAFCGTLALRFADNPSVGDVGYWLGEEHWGQGLATEAVFLAGHLAFAHLSATVLTAEVFVGNDASCRVLEKNGYRREPGVRTRALEGRATRADKEEWVFTLTRTDFQALTERPATIAENVRLARR